MKRIALVVLLAGLFGCSREAPAPAARPGLDPAEEQRIMGLVEARLRTEMVRTTEEQQVPGEVRDTGREELANLKAKVSHLEERQATLERKLSLLEAEPRNRLQVEEPLIEKNKALLKPSQPEVEPVKVPEPEVEPVKVPEPEVEPVKVPEPEVEPPKDLGTILDSSSGVDEPGAVSQYLELLEFKVTSGIDRSTREPVDEETSYQQSAGKVYCWMAMKNLTEEERIATVVWVRRGKEVSRIEMKVGPSAPRWRTWAYILVAKRPGDWEVRLLDQDGVFLGKKEFVVEDA